jgi:hydroxymethylbilane synthase
MNATASPVKTIRIATRQSKLALWQAEHVASRLRAAHAGLDVHLVPMTTQGDRVLDRSLAQVGGKGLFVKELELALLEQRADIAVHSLKDVPSELPDSMVLTAFLTRANAQDAFVSRKYPTFLQLPARARIGTSSLRRQSQLLARRSDLVVEPLRGNVDTRLKKLDAGDYDAIILASAGLHRLGLESRITEYLSLDLSVPAVGQGIVAIECRAQDDRSRSLAAALNDATAEDCALAERAFARRLAGSCQSPIAGHAEISADALTLTGLVGSLDGKTIFRDSVAGKAASAEDLGISLAERLLARGADDLLRELR